MKQDEVSKEAALWLQQNDGGKDWVLVRSGDDSLKYVLVNKRTFSMLLVDDIPLAKELIEVLVSRGAEEFASIKEMESKYGMDKEKPKFWPKDKKWPPK